MTANENTQDRPQGWARVVAFETARVLLAAVVAGVLLAQFLPKRTPAPIDWPALPAGWSAAPWPYLRDQFDPGVAARCGSAECPVKFEIAIRPKRGFCDCERGVYDDVQLREVGDLDLAGARFTPRAPGEVWSIAGMNGRWRLHAGPDGRPAISAALHKGCDVIVIVARDFTSAQGDELRNALLAFLRQPALSAWLAALLGDKRPA